MQSDQANRPTRLYILDERDLEKIDGLTNMLNLAITEIFASKAAHHSPHTHNPIQEKFNEQCYQIIDPPKTRPE